MNQLLPKPLQKILQLAKSKTGTVLYFAVVGNLLRFVSALILSRILSPESFGLVGIISSILFAVAMLTDLGFYAYLVRSQRLDDAVFLDHIWTIRLLRALLLAFLLFLTAPYISQIFDQSALTTAIRISAFTFIAEAGGSLNLFKAVVNTEVKKIGVLELIAQSVQVTASIALALLLDGFLALVWATLLGSAVKAGLTYSFFGFRRHKFAFNAEAFWQMWAFSKTIALSSVATLCIHQIDKFALAKTLSIAEFGLYSIAFSLASTPSIFTSNYVNQLIYPRFVKAIFDNCSTSSFYYRYSFVTALAFMFACGFVAGSSELIVHILYDKRYEGSALYLAILMLVPIIGFSCALSSQLFNAAGKTAWTLEANLIRLGGMVIMTLVGLKLFGSLGVVFAAGLIEVPPLIYSFIRQRQLGALSFTQEGVRCFAAIAGAILGLAIANGYKNF